jgi:hypothetical protein
MRPGSVPTAAAVAVAAAAAAASPSLRLRLALRRYSVDYSNGKLLDGELSKGKERILAYMRARVPTIPQAEVDAFLADKFDKPTLVV